MAKDTLKTKFNFSRKQLDELLLTLNQLKSNARQGLIHRPDAGICWNWDRLLQQFGRYPNTSFDVVLCLAMEWPGTLSPGKFCAYPVPHGYPYWSGLALDARLDLMDYIAKRLRDWRRRTPA